MVKRIIAIVFILYQNINITEIISYDVHFNKLKLTQHLTTYRSHGLDAIVRRVHSS
ncbi:SufE family protein [secondary endosymbiont of Trabutina mannipara]|uniref:SufE family protein n=1 Tax=secondary endosymbiont of Trabutina mannipara TaxID=1835721 RepID=UPI0038B650E0